MYNTAKYFAWLDVNESTPFHIKITVLYSCMFSSLLYSVEAWGDTEKFKEKVLATERKLLKKCLGVKSGTHNDLIYHEVKRPDLIAIIKDRQYKFFKKISVLSAEDSMVKSVTNLYNKYMGENTDSKIMYYSKLSGNEKEVNKSQRLNLIDSSDRSSIVTYRSVVGTGFNHVLYKSNLNDEDRKIITRWRLSNHNLRVEKGRYTIPFTPRTGRVCIVCNVVEDEAHALFICKIHHSIRIRFKLLLEHHPNVQSLLNPTSVCNASVIASYLRHIENSIDLTYGYMPTKRR